MLGFFKHQRVLTCNIVLAVYSYSIGVDLTFKLYYKIRFTSSRRSLGIASSLSSDTNCYQRVDRLLKFYGIVTSTLSILLIVLFISAYPVVDLLD